MDKINHYKWLDKHLNSFWIEVFGKTLIDSGFAGIIVSHGDKCDGYKKEWQQNGIPFPHGVALYMLTYTTEIGDIPKYLSKDWVIQNYPKYKDLLPDINESDPDVLSAF